MRRQGDLPFHWSDGSCHSFLKPFPQILLCFSGIYEDYTEDHPNDPEKTCHSLVCDDILFTDSKFDLNQNSTERNVP